MAAKKRSKKAAAKKVAKSPVKKAKKAAPRAKKKAAKGKAKKVAKSAAPVAKAAPKKVVAKKAVKAVEPPAAAVGSKKARKAKSKKATKATGKAKEASPEEDAFESNEVSVDGIGRGSSAPGCLAPGFKVADQHGGVVTSAELRGKPYVLYFYPKDETSGCTTEACDFRDHLAKFDRAGVRVIGVSPDSSESHAKFSKHHGLSFTLLADTARELANSYGVWVKKKNYGREYMGIKRSTFLIDSKGMIRAAWHGVKVPGHVAQVLSQAEKLAN